MSRQEQQRGPQKVPEFGDTPFAEYSIDAREALENMIASCTSTLEARMHDRKVGIQRREVPNQPFDHIKHQLEGKVTLLARLRDAIDVGARITPQHLKLLTSEVEEISRYETSLVAPSGRYSGSLPHYEAERMTRLERELARKYASTLTLLTAMINASLTR